MKFKNKELVEVKTEKSKVTLPILITENKNKQPLLGLVCLDKLEIGLPCSRDTNITWNITMDEKSTKLLNEFEDLFKNNHTIEDLTS